MDEIKTIDTYEKFMTKVEELELRIQLAVVKNQLRKLLLKIKNNERRIYIYQVTNIAPLKNSKESSLVIIIF